MSLSVIILAAGLGTRMRSKKPKVLHLLAGKPLLEHVIARVQSLKPMEIFCVVGHGHEQIKSQLGHYPVQWVYQAEQLGTGHAVLQALPQVNSSNQVLVLYGDVPLITLESLRCLIDSMEKNTLSLLVANVANPAGLGRIVRDSAGQLQRIVEEKDATAIEKAIHEINIGVLVTSCQTLNRWLPHVTTKNNQHEYYLPDVVNLAVAAGESVATCAALSEEEILGINTRAQLAALERVYQAQCADRLMAAGVSLADPARFDLRGNLLADEDVFIDSNVLFEGDVQIGSGSMVGPNNHIRNARIGKNVVIKANCVIEDAEIGDGCVIGPFARIRPQTVLKENVHVGNFVEVKKTVIGKDSKANHLTYLGDAVIGEKVNVGAGTITCNYDGVNKFQTIIEDGAFIGSNTSLVAPVRVGNNATIGAGSTITKEAPDEMLTLARSKQINIPGWKRPKKEGK